MRRAVGPVAVAVGLLTAGACRPAPPADVALLARSWAGYQARFVTQDGRVRRPESGDDTVSEGQAYLLLRAAWMDDRAAFDRTWRWTRRHLLRDGSALMAWHWTPEGGGRVDDWSAAPDADVDAALALLIAADRWGRPGDASLPPYRDAARAILASLLADAVVADADGTPVLLAGRWADQRRDGRGLVLNPSYFSPAAYREFARTTGDARWLALAAGSYRVLDALCGSTPAHAAVPDWVRWTSASVWAPEPAPGGAAPRSSWDAVRVAWRVATDLAWFGTPEAAHFLARCLAPASREAVASGRGMAVERALDGTVLGAEDHPLANAMASFALTSPAERDRLLARVRARVVVTQDGTFFGEPDRYYVNSLAWLPFALRAGRMGGPTAKEGEEGWPGE